MKKIVATAVIIASACGVFGGREIMAENTITHTVKKGDTLWDLSENYLNDPLLWPKIWNINPGIARPHWIYPGQVFKIPGRGGTPAMKADAGSGVGPVASDSSALAKAGMASFSEPLPVIVAKELPQTEVQAKTDRGIAQIMDYDPGIGMVTNEIPSAGRVLHTEQGWKGAAVGEAILISAPGAPVGRQFGVYRDMGKVEPLSYFDESPGHLLADIAIVEIVASDASGQRAVIRQAFAEVKTGDVLGQVQERTKVSPRPVQAGTATAAKGSVVAFHFMRRLAGPGDIVYLNIGANQGLAPGDLLSVAGADQAALRTSGEIMILRVAANTAAAVVTKRSAHEVHRGDVVGPPVM